MMKENEQEDPMMPNEIDAYIAACPAEVQEKLKALREVIREEAPLAKEKISYGLPTFHQEQNLIHFAAFEGHIGVYPGSEAMEVFAEELKGYSTSKGTIRIPLTEPLPFPLIRRIVQYRLKAVEALKEERKRKKAEKAAHKKT